MMVRALHFNEKKFPLHLHLDCVPYIITLLKRSSIVLEKANFKWPSPLKVIFFRTIITYLYYNSEVCVCVCVCVCARFI